MSEADAKQPVPSRPPARPTRKRRGWVWIVVLLVVAAGATGATFYFAGDTAGGPDIGPIATVTRGPLVVKIVESCEIEAEKRKIIRNELPWTAIIKEVVDDGSFVEPNDTIIAFDCQELEDSRKKQELDVTSSRNQYTQAVKSLELKIEEMDNRVRKARDELVDANDALRRYIKSDYAIQLRDLKTEIDMANRNLAVAKDQLELKLKVNQDPELKGLYSEKVIEAARFDVDKYETAVKKAEAKLAMFKEFDNPKEQRRLKTALRDAELGVKRAELEAKNEVDKATADVTAKKIRKEMQEEDLVEMAEHASNMTIKAKEPGLVIYNTRRRHWQTPVEVAVSEKISRHQQLMIIPDMTSLQVKTKVLEAVSRLVEKGLDAYIRLDAFPDNVYDGTVHWIAPQAGAQHWFDPTVKVHDVIVKFDDYPPDIKPKMTGKVEIIIADLPDALQVPVAAVFTEQEATFVWRKGPDGRPEKVEVKVGLSNETQVEIKSGLKEGDKVLLVPEDGIEPAREQQQDTAEENPGPSGPMGGTPGE